MLATAEQNQATEFVADKHQQSAWFFLRSWLAPSVIVLYSLLNFLIISPAGNFPLNDDWIYSESVFHLLQTGHFHLLGCAAAPLLLIAIGAVASSLFGQSHEILRGITVIFGLITSLVFYATLCAIGLKRGQSALIAMILAVNPLFVNLSYSCMTDVPALMFSSLYVFFVITALKTQSTGRTIAAGAMLCCSILVRQSFVALVACNIALLLLAKGNPRRMCLALLLSGVLAPCVIAASSEHFFVAGNEFIATYSWEKSLFTGAIQHLITSPIFESAAMLERIFKIFCYFGIYCLPLIPGAVRQLVLDFKCRRTLTIASVVLVLAIAIPSFYHTVCFQRHLMPFSENLLRIPMIGPLNLMGICVAGLKMKYRVWLTIISAILSLPLMTIVIVFLLKTVSSILPMIKEWQAGKAMTNVGSNSRLTAMFICLFFVTTLGCVCLQHIAFDMERYDLMALPALLLCFAWYAQQSGLKIIYPVATALLVLLAGYSTLATQDYMSWNRARWQAIRELESSGVSPLKIDGGPEYNYLANPALIKECLLGVQSFGITHRGAYPRSEWRWWSISGEDYIISFSPVPGYDIVARHPFSGGLTLSYRDVLTLGQHPGFSPP